MGIHRTFFGLKTRNQCALASLMAFLLSSSPVGPVQGRQNAIEQGIGGARAESVDSTVKSKVESICQKKKSRGDTGYVVPPCRNTNLNFNTNRNTNPLYPNTKVILFASGSYKEGSFDANAWDEGTKNLFLITLANVYDAVRERGFDKNNIQVFYHDGTCDRSETRDQEKIRTLLLEQKIYKGTKENLFHAIAGLPGKNEFGKSEAKPSGSQKKAGSQTPSPDTVLSPALILYFTGHGVKRDPESSPELEFEVSSEQDKWDYSSRGYGPPSETLTVHELQGLLDSVSGSKIVVVDSCYSGYFCRRIAGEGIAAVASSSEKGEAVWSRVDQFGRFFFGVPDRADQNSDGTITLEEALNFSEQYRRPYLERHARDGDIADPKGAEGALFGDGKTVLYRVRL